jgi:hypothetical protein
MIHMIQELFGQTLREKTHRCEPAVDDPQPTSVSWFCSTALDAEQALP